VFNLKIDKIKKVISEILFFLYLENMVIYLHWTCQWAKSLP